MLPCFFRAENLLVVPLTEYNLAINLLLHVDFWHTFKRYVQIKDQYCQYTEHTLIKNIWCVFLKALYKMHKNTLIETKFGVLRYNSSLLRCEKHCSDFTLKGLMIFLFICWPTKKKKTPKINPTLLDQRTVI